MFNQLKDNLIITLSLGLMAGFITGAIKGLSSVTNNEFFAKGMYINAVFSFKYFLNQDIAILVGAFGLSGLSITLLCRFVRDAKKAGSVFFAVILAVIFFLKTGYYFNRFIFREFWKNSVIIYGQKLPAGLVEPKVTLANILITLFACMIGFLIYRGAHRIIKGNRLNFLSNLFARFNFKIIGLAMAVVLFFNGTAYVVTRDGRGGGPNVILVVVDTLRADYLGAYGHKSIQTPNIDGLAKSGVLFQRAISTTPNTATSMSSLMTSSYPYRHGVNYQENLLHSSNVTLAEIMKERGYYTGAVIGNPILARENGYAQGFDTFFQKKSVEFKAAEVTDTAVEWLERNGRKKFFMWIHYMDPHWTYEPPPPFDTMYISDPENDKEIREYTEKVKKGIIPLENVYLYNTLGNEAVQTMIGKYMGEISYNDKHIGRLLKELDRMQLSEDTIIIFTADHGESLGEHNLHFMHDLNLYDPSLWVPLIIKGPRTMKIQVGEIKKQVRHIDIVPTIMDFIGADNTGSFTGKTLAPLLRGEKEDFPRTAFSQTVPIGLSPDEKIDFKERPGVFLDGLHGMWRAIRTDKWKMVYIPGKEKDIFELYNLTEDPRERRDLVKYKSYLLNVVEERNVKTGEKLKEELLSWVKDNKVTEKSLTRKLTEGRKEKLRSLGYIQ